MSTTLEHTPTAIGTGIRPLSKRPSTFSILGASFPWESLTDDLPVLEYYSSENHQVFLALTKEGDRHLYIKLGRRDGWNVDDETEPRPGDFGELRVQPQWSWMNEHMAAPGPDSPVTPAANNCLPELPDRKIRASSDDHRGTIEHQHHTRRDTEPSR